MGRGLSDVDRIVGEGVALARVRRGLSQAELADELGMTAEAVADLERGVARPTAAQLMEIGAALGVDTAFFFALGGALATPASDAPTAEEGLRLMRAFHRIASHATREKVIAHVEALADRA